MPKTAVKPLFNGFINLYKPSGITSMDALRRIKRLSEQKQKVGHGGTMDPLAKGVLPVCFGQATRLMDHVVEGRKKYLMEVLFGVTTTTYDKEGEVVDTRDASGLTLPQVEDALSTFDRVIDQLPPMYSAVKAGPRRCGGGAKVSSSGDSRHSHHQFESPDLGVGSRVRQGSLHAVPGARPWRVARLRRPCGGLGTAP